MVWESRSQSGSVAIMLAGLIKRPIRPTRAPRATLISFMPSGLVLLELLPGVMLGLFDRFNSLEWLRLLKLEVKKDEMDTSSGR